MSRRHTVAVTHSHWPILIARHLQRQSQRQVQYAPEVHGLVRESAPEEARRYGALLAAEVAPLRNVVHSLLQERNAILRARGGLRKEG
jgi:hypothetical protein